MIKDTLFYNKESMEYSEKRYPKISNTYTQFFFKERLALLRTILANITKGKEDLTLLEVGCADGVVLQDICTFFSNHFASLVGIDISPGMIASAKQKHANSKIDFQMRDTYQDIVLKDIIVEVGVINYASLEEEISFLSSHVDPSGYCLISLAGSNSLWNKIKPGDKGYRHFLSYKKYEEVLQSQFEIIKSIPVGLFMPLIWRFPRIARYVQSMEVLFRPFIPNLFHEKIYLLKKKTQ